MPLIGQALNPGYYWSGSKVCAGPSAPRYQGAIACWEYYRAPSDVFATVAPSPFRPPPPSPLLPNILPPVERPDQPPTDQAPISAVADRACGGCRKSSTAATNPLSGTPAPATPPGARSAPTTSLPWWLYVLAALTLAQVVYGRND